MLTTASAVYLPSPDKLGQTGLTGCSMILTQVKSSEWRTPRPHILIGHVDFVIHKSTLSSIYLILLVSLFTHISCIRPFHFPFLILDFKHSWTVWGTAKGNLFPGRPEGSQQHILNRPQAYLENHFKEGLWPSVRASLCGQKGPGTIPNTSN